MGFTMNTAIQNIYNDSDVEELMSELENALGMMEPYYSQNGGGKFGYALLARLQEKKMLVSPFKAFVKEPYKCSICGQVFSHSDKKKPLHKEAQHSAAMYHMSTVHGIAGKARKTHIEMPEPKEIEFKNRVEYLNFANKNPHLV